MRKVNKKMLLAGGLIAAAISVLGMGTAVADPPSTPPHNGIVGTGSDTIQFVTDQLATDYNATYPTRPRQWFNFDAVPPGNITEKTGCTSRTRPNGSGAGISELAANLHPSGDSTDFCVDYARSSRARQVGDPANLVFIPFAYDAVAWAADLHSGRTNAPGNLSTTQLKAIYSCDASLLNTGKTGPVTWNEVGGTGTAAVVPVIPQSTSGTRAFFLTKIGVTTLGSCVQGQDNTVEENEGTNAIFSTSKAPNIVFPYSVAVWLSQAEYGTSPADEGSMALRHIDGVAPVSGTKPNQKINANFGYIRNVYFVVRDANSGAGLAVPSYLQNLFGNGTAGTAWICKGKAAKDITNYGFLPFSGCGQLQ